MNLGSKWSITEIRSKYLCWGGCRNSGSGFLTICGSTVKSIYDNIEETNAPCGAESVIQSVTI